MSNELTISLDTDSLTTGQMLTIMKSQELLARNEKTAESMETIIDIIGKSVTGIEYKGQTLQSLHEIPFRHLKNALADIMRQLAGTDPN